LLEVLLALAILGLFVAGGVFLIVKYNSMSQGIARISSIEAASSFVRHVIRQDSVLRKSRGTPEDLLTEINDRLSAIENDLNGSEGSVGFLTRAGFENTQISLPEIDETSVVFNGVSWTVYTIEAILFDTRGSSKEERVYVTISAQ